MPGYDIDERFYDANASQFFLLINNNFNIQDDPVGEAFNRCCDKVMVNCPSILHLSKFFNFPAVQKLWSADGTPEFPGFAKCQEMVNAMKNLELPPLNKNFGCKKAFGNKQYRTV